MQERELQRLLLLFFFILEDCAQYSYVVCVYTVACEMRPFVHALFHNDRRMWPTYFSRKAGGTPGCGYQRTCLRITGYSTWIGCTTSGDLTASSRTRKRSLSMRCPYRITISGCITTRRCFTCPSEMFANFSYFNLRLFFIYFLAIFLFTNDLRFNEQLLYVIIVRWTM